MNSFTAEYASGPIQLNVHISQRTAAAGLRWWRASSLWKKLSQVVHFFAKFITKIRPPGYFYLSINCKVVR